MGKSVDINEDLLSSPESIGKDPYGQSWLVESTDTKNLVRI